MLESVFLERNFPIQSDALDQAGAGLDKILAQSLRLAAPGQAPLLAWPLVCGSAVAERTRAFSFRDGILHVEVADPGWKSELQSLAHRYLAGINRYTKEPVIRIEFVAPAPDKNKNVPR
jgi:predicted nucleic acid-binding Zn ribbon protein